MERQNEEEEVSSTSESSSASAVYSPHTQGFPPSSHTVPSNPFSTTKKGWVEVKGTNPPATSTFSTSFLRPSKLEAGLGSTIFTKHSTPPPPPQQQQPAPTPEKDEVQDGAEAGVKGESAAVAGAGVEVEYPQPPTTIASENQEKEDPDSSETTAGKETTNPTVTETENVSTLQNGLAPLSTAAVTTTAAEEPKKETINYSPAPPPGFIFGSNLNDRVENVSKGVANGDGHDKNGEIRPERSGSPESGKRKWDAACPVTTGEEDESNVMQTSCRLFAFDVENSNWIERGRGQLRLNDRQEGGNLHSRLIVRTKGSLRLMLNTPVFPEMVIERSSEKCVKITGQDDGEGSSSVKLFLIQCSTTDAETLHSALEWRLRSILSASSNVISEGEGDAEEEVVVGAGAEECSISESKLTKQEGDVDSSGTSPPKKPKLSP